METKESILKMLDDAMAAKKFWIIGRACWRLWQKQTADEQATESTQLHNNQGFTGGDAKWCSKMGKFYNDGLTKYKMQPNSPKIFSEKQAIKTAPRLRKYANQLAKIHNALHKPKAA